jgi:hypothetical protein
MLHGILAEMGREDETYLTPKWIVAANETIARMSGKPPEEIASAFRAKIRGTAGGRP